MDVVGCFIYYKGEILLLKRQNHKPQPNTWGIPSGKVELGESFEDAVKREIEEETGLVISKEQFIFKRSFQVIHNISIDYHVFYIQLDYKPQITIDINSHSDFCWIVPEEALKRDDLIQDLDMCIQEIFT